MEETVLPLVTLISVPVQLITLTQTARIIMANARLCLLVSMVEHAPMATSLTLVLVWLDILASHALLKQTIVLHPVIPV